MKFFPPLNGLAVLASITFFHVSHSLAQTAQVDPQQLGQSGDGPVAVVSFSDGSWLAATAERGLSSLIGLQPNDQVTLELSFPQDFAGQPIGAESLDGGTLSSSQRTATLNADGVLSLTFAAGVQPGLHRIALRAGGAVSILRFWVIDPANPSSHPTLLSSSR
jgi:hypothetical protein